MVFVNRMHYYYIMRRYEEALQCGRRASEALAYFKGFKEEQEYYYIYSLTLLAVCKTTRPLLSSSDRAETGEQAGDDDDEQALKAQGFSGIQFSEEHLELINLVIENQKRFKPVSDEAPINYSHQYLLVEAELERVR